MNEVVYVKQVLRGRNICATSEVFCEAVKQRDLIAFFSFLYVNVCFLELEVGILDWAPVFNSKLLLR